MNPHMNARPDPLAPPLRVLIAADNALARAGLAALLRDAVGLEVVGQCMLADVLEPALDLHLPDVVLCDLGYDPLRLAGLLAELASDGPPFVALLPTANSAAEATALLAGAGVRGMLLQNSEPEQFALALRAVGAGMTVFGPGLAPSLAMAASAIVSDAVVEPLTPREREVLALLAEGLPNKLIARQLHISEHTVKFHLNGLLTKLGAASRTEAVVRATRLGLIAL
jgi:DNA-binding NarL/FixJ family response regulator